MRIGNRRAKAQRHKKKHTDTILKEKSTQAQKEAQRHNLKRKKAQRHKKKHTGTIFKEKSTHAQK